MMRRPTHKNVQMLWHSAAMRGEEPPIYDGHPQVGWYRRRLVKGGVFVPARIWLLQDIDPDTGELRNDEIFMCEVNGESRDPVEEWLWLAANPIPQSEYDYLVSLQDWAAWHRPDAPEANPRKPVDMNDVDLPFI